MEIVILCAAAFGIGMGVEWVRERKYRRELQTYHKEILKQHRRRMERW